MNFSFFETLLIIFLSWLIVVLYIKISSYFFLTKLKRLYLEVLDRNNWKMGFLIKVRVEEKIKKEITPAQHIWVLFEIKNKGLIEKKVYYRENEKVRFPITKYRLTEKGEQLQKNTLLHA